MVHRAAKGNPNTALRAFDQAEQEFGRIASQNEILHRLLNSRGEVAIKSLMGTAAEKKGGDLQFAWRNCGMQMAPQEIR